MAQKLWVLVVVLSLMAGGTAAAQDAGAILQAASTAIGAGNVKSIQYSGTGWNAATGQSFSPNDDWPRFDVTSYTRTIDYDASSGSSWMLPSMFLFTVLRDPMINS